MGIEVGIVFNYRELPDVSQFPFVIHKKVNGTGVKKGQFVQTETSEGLLVGYIEKIVLLNEYFSDALTIKAYSNEGSVDALKGLFPSEDFEYAVAIVRNLGIFDDDDSLKSQKVKRMTYPASPGKKVYFLEKDTLEIFLGLNPKKGIRVGNVKNSDVEANIDMDRLLNKHFAVLSVSGGGKSYLVSVIIEELLTRNVDHGIPAIVLIDVHGEYTYLQSVSKLKHKVQVKDASYFQLSVPNMNAYSFKKYQEQITQVQLRELRKCIKHLKKDETKKNAYSIQDIIKEVEREVEGNKSTKQALLGWLSELERLTLFGHQENPVLKSSVKQGQLTIFNLQNEISIRKKQIIVDYICQRLFFLRRTGKIPPFLIIIEEAHQFCPEAAQSKALSKHIIETIAREGRKFMACLCLISQRPKKLSATALSQLNSKAILNIKNPYDLKHLMDSSEKITKDSANMISSLGVGEMLLMGNAINYPIYIDVRERKFKSESENLSLSQVCLNWKEQHLS